MKKSQKKESAKDSPGRGRPATGKTPVRSIRIDDETWASWQAAAEAEGLSSVTEWIKSRCRV